MTLLLTMMLSISAGSCRRAYDGPGTDHPFVGRSTDEIVTGGYANTTVGSLDGQPVRIVRRLDRDGPTFATADCMHGRVNLVVDGTRIVAATVEDCSFDSGASSRSTARPGSTEHPRRP